MTRAAPSQTDDRIGELNRKSRPNQRACGASTCPRHKPTTDRASSDLDAPIRGDSRDHHASDHRASGRHRLGHRRLRLPELRSLRPQTPRR